MLSDSATYSVVKKDPMRIINNLRDLLVRWRRAEFINNVEYKFLLSIDSVIPRIGYQRSTRTVTPQNYCLVYEQFVIFLSHLLT